MSRSARALPWIAALALFLPCVLWTWTAFVHASYEPFGRDQGIFQYVAWAMSRGFRDYVDVRDFNGPLVPLIHLTFLKLGGADEHVFRCLDLGAFSLAALVYGASLPGVGDRASGQPAEVMLGSRVLWALAAWVVLGAGYMMFDWWSHAQRESFFDDLLLPSLGLQLLAHRPITSTKARSWAFAAAGLLGSLTWFGKPSCLVYSVGQAMVVVIDDELPGDRRRSLMWLAAGCGVGCVVMTALLVVYGDPAAFVNASRLVVLRLHKYIWHKSILETYAAWNNAPKIHYILATFVAGFVPVALRALPRRLLVPWVLLAGGIVNFVVQGKGFPYHLQSAMLGVHVVWLTAAAALVERASRAAWRSIPVASAALVVAVLEYQIATETVLSPPYTADWVADRLSGGPESERFLRHFTGGDYFAWDIHRAAAFVRENTGPDDRVQTYGMDPYVMVLAQRLGATPYIYNFELDVDSALAGHPTPSDRDWMIAAARDKALDLEERLERDPPAAFISMDRVPYTFPDDADVEFAAHCPEAARFLRSHYRLAQRFGTVRVWLREGAVSSARAERPSP